MEMILIIVIVSLNRVTPKIKANIVDRAKKVPSVCPKGYLERIIPMINLEVKAKIRAKTIEKLKISVIQKFPVKRLGNSLSISMFPIFNNTSPRLYIRTVTPNNNQ
jgi:hypothetical protein